VSECEIIGGFVEQAKTSAGLQHQLCDQDARAFAAGEPPHALIQIPPKTETARPTPPRESRAPDKSPHRYPAAQSTAQSDVWIKLAALVEVDDLQSLGPANLARLRLDSPRSSRSKVVLPLPFGPTSPTVCRT